MEGIAKTLTLISNFHMGEDMLFKIKKSTNSWRSLLILLLLLYSSMACADKWKFLVYGDSRGLSVSSPVNTTILSELARATTNEKPAFVLVPGDLCCSGSATAFQEWTNAMAPVYQAGIAVYPIIGNHDANDVDGFINIFGASIPDNGPVGEIDRTYFVIYSNALILAVDNYVDIHKVNQPWIDSVLASNVMPHVFVLGHEPAFNVCHVDTLDDYPSNRNTFWTSLIRAKVNAYFCGHDHFYDHMRLDDGDGNPANDVHQYLVGTAGAPLYGDGFYDGNNGSWFPQRIFHEAQYGYLIVEIDRLDVSITWMHRTAPDTYVATADISSRHVLPQRPSLDIRMSGDNADLRITKVTPSASNTVQRINDLKTGTWTTEHQFVTFSNAYEWLTPIDASNVFYRVISE